MNDCLKSVLKNINKITKSPIKDRDTFNYIASLIDSALDSKTDVACLGCGNLMWREGKIDAIYQAVVLCCGKMPRHRKSRVQQKWRNQWEKHANQIIVTSIMLIQFPKFFCKSCGLTIGSQNSLISEILKNQEINRKQQNINSILAEIETVKGFLSELSEEECITRLSFQGRLDSLNEELVALKE
jgi:hypothetical protein